MFALKCEPAPTSAKSFGLWRVCFGFFLTYYYLRLFPYAAELFSREGAFPHLALGHRFYPAFLLGLDSPAIVRAIVGACAGFSFLIMVGLWRRVAAFALWLLICWLYARNFYTDSPDYSFVNWLVFILILIPEGEAFSLSVKNPKWEMPDLLYAGAWIVLTVGYCAAGIYKLKFGEPAWRDGSALYYVLTTDNTRMGWYGTLFDRIPKTFFCPLSWGVVFLQIASPVLVAFRKARPLWWLAMTGMHVGILVFINLPEVAWGMILFHAFLWDPRWLKVFDRRQDL